MEEQNITRLIIDTDVGCDDAVAIVAALRTDAFSALQIVSFIRHSSWDIVFMYIIIEQASLLLSLFHPRDHSHHVHISGHQPVLNFISARALLPKLPCASIFFPLVHGDLTYVPFHVIGSCIDWRTAFDS